LATEKTRLRDLFRFPQDFCNLAAVRKRLAVSSAAQMTKDPIRDVRHDDLPVKVIRGSREESALAESSMGILS
jgi:hypothetical protein